MKIIPLIVSLQIELFSVSDIMKANQGPRKITIACTKGLLCLRYTEMGTNSKADGNITLDVTFNHSSKFISVAIFTSKMGIIDSKLLKIIIFH